jgi:hypothetical protein
MVQRTILSDERRELGRAAGRRARPSFKTSNCLRTTSGRLLSNLPDARQAAIEKTLREQKIK